MNLSHLPFWLAALYLPNMSPRLFMQALSHFCGIESLFHASDDALLAAGLTARHIQAIKQPDWKSVERDLAWGKGEDHHLITLTADDYPHLLKEITDPPLVLYAMGNKKALAQSQIAMVGSRHATPIGLKNAGWFAFALAEAGLAITSGFALGVDACSHKGALSAKGITIGVAGTGLHHIYPRAHKKLVEEILHHRGVIISEFPLHTGPHHFNFPRRNRIISGLSIGVLVIEAALQSGSLITARHALEQGREVFAIPGSIHNPLARGCHQLIRQGAVLVESAQDILTELGALQAYMSYRETLPQQGGDSASLALTDGQSKILHLIENEITPMNVILLRSGLTAGEVSSILLALELNGYIESLTGGYIRTLRGK
jgi:DNA processing protein